MQSNGQEQERVMSAYVEKFDTFHTRYGNIVQRKLLFLCQKKISDEFPDKRGDFLSFYEYFENLLTEKPENFPLQADACRLIRNPHHAGNKVAHELDSKAIAEIILAEQNLKVKSSFCEIFEYVFLEDPEKLVFES